MTEQAHLAKINTFSWLRLRALCRKEIRQILRDPCNALIAFVIPLLLLFIFSYGINLDSNKLHVGILLEQQSEQARSATYAFIGSPYIKPIISNQRQQLLDLLQAGKIRGLIVIPVNFDQQRLRAPNNAAIEVITDGSEPNTANFVQSYAQGIWQNWLAQQAAQQGQPPSQLINVEPRYWFNASAKSQHFIIPGAITIIMTVISTMLTSLVISREWERGTMEALIATQVTLTELLLSKLLPHYLLGMIAMLVCMSVSVLILGVPYRGSLLILFLLASLFLFSTLGMGLLISTLVHKQFNAAMIALNAAFLPAIMLSGFIFEINSMPTFVRAVTYLVPARYFVSTMQTLFLAGNIGPLLLLNTLFLVVASAFFIGLTAWKTKLVLK